jgi:hypothetical protein
MSICPTPAERAICPPIVSEPIFGAPRFLEAARHQILDPLLCGRSTERSDARTPPSAQLNVRRQAGVNEALGLADRPIAELGDPGRERLDERIKLGCSSL